MSVAETSVDETSVNETSVNETSFDKMLVDEMSVGQMTFNCKTQSLLMIPFQSFQWSLPDKKYVDTDAVVDDDDVNFPSRRRP
jgi:hypothetical protein